MFVSLGVSLSYAEQLLLYMKAAEYLSSALHSAMEDIRQGRLFPSSTVKQGVTSVLLFKWKYIRRV